jgi:hypothetical protein
MIFGHTDQLSTAIFCLFYVILPYVTKWLHNPEFSVTITSNSFDSLEGGTCDEIMVVTLQYVDAHPTALQTCTVSVAQKGLPPVWKC